MLEKAPTQESVEETAPAVEGTADGRTILYATDGKIKKVGNVEVNSLRIKGSGQNSNFEDILPQNSEKSSGDAKISLSAEHKQNQLAIIEETNPAPNSYLTWVRSVDDIKTLAETLEDGDWADAETFNPDLSSRRSKTDRSAATHC